MDLADRIARALALQPEQVRATVALLDDGNTVPFVARYRKERTGNLDETQLRAIEAESARLRQLEERRASILGTLREVGPLPPGLEARLLGAETLTGLEDLYAPWKPKRSTRGGKALDAGLEPVARAIAAGRDPYGLAKTLISAAFPEVEAVVKGGQDILAEEMASEPELRRDIRELLRREGMLVCKKRRGAEENPTFADYYAFQARVKGVRPHQVLAIRRGEAEKALSASVEVDDERIVSGIASRKRAQGLYAAALADGYQRLLKPAVERDVRRELDDAADRHAIDVFAINLKNLLRQPPLPDRRVLGVDPGYRTGCKLAVVDGHGAVLWTGVVYVHDNRKEEAPQRLREVLKRYDVDVVAIGNGTASTEAQQAVASAIEGGPVRYAVVDEAGASVYSASELAIEEMPDLDVTLRGAVSIARRLQDPLAELVKIEPKAIGVGMYQHDVDQAELERALEAVVVDAVNAVGVDLASASKRLLTHVSGIGPTLADRIVAWRDAAGFRSRAQLREVKGIGDRTYEQCAGFLRVRGGPEPLDATPIHPESYPAARAIRAAAGVPLGDPGLPAAIDRLRRGGELQAIADKFGLGRFTLDDLLEALVRPGRDPRQDVAPPELRAKQLTLDDLAPGTRLVGTVRNVVDFGAFVDIGVHHEGLVHVSQMSRTFVRDPHAVVAVGDRVEVTVLAVDKARGRVSLSMIAP